MLKYICRDHKSITKLLYNVLPLMTLQYFSGPWENVAKLYSAYINGFEILYVFYVRLCTTFTAFQYFSGSLENIAKLLL